MHNISQLTNTWTPFVVRRNRKFIEWLKSRNVSSVFVTLKIAVVSLSCPCSIVTLVNVSRGGIGFHLRLSVCLSVFRTVSRQPTQQGPHQKMFHQESWKSTYFGVERLKVKGQGHESQKHCRRGFMHSCECWLLLVSDCSSFNSDIRLAENLFA